MSVKKERLQRLNELVNRLSAESNAAMQGQTVEVLIEGESKKNPDVLSGRTRTNKRVNVRTSKDKIGQLIYAKITNVKTWSLDGELVEYSEVQNA